MERRGKTWSQQNVLSEGCDVFGIFATDEPAVFANQSGSTRPKSPSKRYVNNVEDRDATVDQSNQSREISVSQERHQEIQTWSGLLYANA